MADVTKEIVLEVGLKDSTAQGTQSAKARLKELQKSLIDMSLAGQDGTKAFRDMEREAAKLKDQIGDTQQRIKQFASDTRTIDTFVGAVQGITAGFQIAQGAAALFGDENEDLQKAMLKVQGAMALANGVQQVANLLNKDSVLITNAQAAAQSLYATAVGVSTGAMRAFRIALLATGIGAAVAAIGLLIAKWDDLTAAVRRYLNLPDPKQRAAEQAMALQREEAQLEQYRQAYDRHTNSLIAADKRRQDAELKKKAARDKAIADRKSELERLKAVEQEVNDARIELQKQFEKAKEDLIIAGMQKEAAARIRFASLENARDTKSKEGELQREADLRQAQQQMADQSFSIIGDIITATAGQSEEAQRKAFNVAKTASIAQALVNTYLGASAALATKTEVFPGQRFVQAALTIAAGLANVAKIRSTQFQGGAGSGSAPAPAAGNATMTPPPTFTSPQTTNLGTGDLSSGQGQGQQNQPMRAYVVERDIQQTTSRVRRLSEFATLG